MVRNYRATCGLVTALFAAAPTVAVCEEMQVKGASLAYDEAGAGPVVLFVHGAISDRRVWAPYRDKIAAERRFVAYDQRHFGESAPEDASSGFSADIHSGDLIAFVEALKAGPVSLVSWSYGGDVAARAAIARPDLFTALVYYEPDVNGLIDGLPGAARAMDDLFARFEPALEKLGEGRDADAALNFIDVVFGLPPGGAAAEPETWQRVWRENGRTLPAYLSAPAGNRATCASLGRIRIPTLVVRGERGHIYDAIMAERLAECQPNSLLVTMTGVNHDGPYRKPAEFAGMIDRFLDLAL